MALYPNLGYGDQPPPQGPPPPRLPPLQVDPKDEEKLKPPARPGSIHSGLNPMVAALEGPQNSAMSALFQQPPSSYNTYEEAPPFRPDTSGYRPLEFRQPPHNLSNFTPQKLAEYIIRGQYQAPNGAPRQVIQPVGNELPAALQAIDRLRMFPNPPGLDTNTLKLQGRL